MQGCIFGPLLLVLYIVDVFRSLRPGTAFLFSAIIKLVCSFGALFVLQTMASIVGI